MTKFVFQMHLHAHVNAGLTAHSSCSCCAQSLNVCSLALRCKAAYHSQDAIWAVQVSYGCRLINLLASYDR